MEKRVVHPSTDERRGKSNLSSRSPTQHKTSVFLEHNNSLEMEKRHWTTSSFRAGMIENMKNSLIFSFIKSFFLFLYLPVHSRFQCVISSKFFSCDAGRESCNKERLTTWFVYFKWIKMVVDNNKNLWWRNSQTQSLSFLKGFQIVLQSLFQCCWWSPLTRAKWVYEWNHPSTPWASARLSTNDEVDNDDPAWN